MHNVWAVALLTAAVHVYAGRPLKEWTVKESTSCNFPRHRAECGRLPEIPSPSMEKGRGADKNRFFISPTRGEDLEERRDDHHHELSRSNRL
jgi:hypothetical protein